MGPVVAVLREDREAILLVLQLLEEFQAALATHPGLAEVGCAGQVGSRFLGAAEGEIGAQRRLLTGRDDAQAGIARANRDRGDAKHQAEDRDHGRLVGAFAAADGVATGNMAELMRDDALQLADIVRRGEQPAVDVDHLALRDEGVDLGIVEQHHADALGVEPGGGNQRIADILEQQFGLAVAQQRLRRGRLRRRE